MPRSKTYDPSKPVCDNQDDFNMAIRKAIRHNNKENIEKAKPWLYTYSVIWMIFLIWSVVLVMKMAPNSDRVIHLVFAIVFSPAYVLSYYLGALSYSK